MSGGVTSMLLKTIGVVGKRAEQTITPNGKPAIVCASAAGVGEFMPVRRPARLVRPILSQLRDGLARDCKPMVEQDLAEIKAAADCSCSSSQREEAAWGLPMSAMAPTGAKFFCVR
jgi:hypothetical protein